MPLSRKTVAAPVTAALLLACALASAHAQTLDQRPVAISGRASVIDGETLEVRGTRIRLTGIEWLVRSGLALAAANGRYRQAEAEARAAKRGMWATGRAQREP
jgi:endonuclease YncB( thermonuclease family)